METLNLGRSWRTVVRGWIIIDAEETYNSVGKMNVSTTFMGQTHELWGCRYWRVPDPWLILMALSMRQTFRLGSWWDPNCRILKQRGWRYLCIRSTPLEEEGVGTWGAGDEATPLVQGVNGEDTYTPSSFLVYLHRNSPHPPSLSSTPTPQHSPHPEPTSSSTYTHLIHN